VRVKGFTKELFCLEAGEK